MIKKRRKSIEDDAIELDLDTLAEKKHELSLLNKDIKTLQEKILSQDNVPTEYNTIYGTLKLAEPINYEVDDNKKLIASGFGTAKFIENAKITPKRIKEIVSEDFYKKLHFLGVIIEKDTKSYFKLCK